MVQKYNVWFAPANADRRLHIYLPDWYYESDLRLPVMYFFDGHNLFFDEDATYGKSWGLKEFLDHWAKPMIIVGIECGHGKDERLSEYLPYHPNHGWYAHLDGYGDATFLWLINELKPMIDQTYRTIPFRECTGIAGSSMGGLMALYGVIHYNRWFSKAACVSSAISTCMSQISSDIYTSDISPDTRVYLSWGTKEARGIKDVNEEDFSSQAYKNNRAVARQLENFGASTTLYCQTGGGHCEADWEKQVPLFMNYLWCE